MDPLTLPAPDLEAVLTPDVLRQLTWNAATLAERLAALPAPGEAPASFDHPSWLRWQRLLAPDDPLALTRRLSWDGLPAGRVVRALAEPAPEDLLPAPWTRWLPAVFGAVSACAAEMAREGRLTERATLAPFPLVPFAEMWIAFLRAGREVLRPEREAWGERVGPRAWAALERQLVVDLSRTGEDVVFTEWRSGFRSRLVSGELVTLLCDYPLFARDLVERVATWVETTREMLARWDADRPALEEAFGSSLEAIVDLDPALSDPHDGGRRVALLHCAAVSIVYKPRDLRLEGEYQRFLRWLGQGGLVVAPPALRMIERPGYGWVERAVCAPFESEDEVRGYFRRAGSLLAIGHLLGARDLHQENVVATRQGPVVVDAEMLLPPAVHEGAVEPDAARESVLASGLLGWIHSDPRGGLFDVGGLQPARPRPRTLPARRWTRLDSDEVEFFLDETFEPRADNRVEQGRRVRSPQDYGADVQAGFGETYAFLLEHRAELLAPEGPLARFGPAPTRVLFRPSDQYGALLQLLTSAGRQRLGVERGIALEALAGVFARDLRRPLLWPLVADESAALHHLEVPRFALASSSVVLHAKSGHAVSGHFAESGLDSARHRLQGLGATDLDRQQALIAAALQPAPPPVAGSLEGEGRQGLVAAAESLAVALVEHGRKDADGGLTWEPFVASLDLYRGQAGPALFLTALASVTGAPRWHDAGAAARRALRRGLERGSASAEGVTSFGGCTGTGSLLYALTVLAKLGGERPMVEAAHELVAGIQTEAIRSHGTFDVEGGLAGLLLGLLAFHESTADWESLEKARACGERLLLTQQKAEAGRAWPSRDGALDTGLAHGAAGIALALARLYMKTGEDRLAAAVREAHRFERSFYSPRTGNWPHRRAQGGTLWLMAWCHGAPGMALARALAPELPGDEEGRTDLEVAIASTCKARASLHDHLCCGSLGQADVLLTVGRANGDRALSTRAHALAAAVAERVLAHGWRGAHTTGFEQGLFEPGFFRGLAGVGYQLLRTAHPDSLPSVLGFSTGEKGTES